MFRMVDIGDNTLYDMRTAVLRHGFRSGTDIMGLNLRNAAILVPTSMFHEMLELMEERDRQLGLPPDVITGNLFFMSIPVEKYHDMVDAARKIEELLNQHVDVMYCERKLPACVPHILPEED